MKTPAASAATFARRVLRLLAITATTILLPAACPMAARAVSVKFTLDYDFDDSDYLLGDGFTGPLIRDTNGNLYGATSFGGPGLSTPSASGRAGVFLKVTPDGTLSDVLNFTNDTPAGPIILGQDGNFYGSSTYGGVSGKIFKITPGGALSILRTFGATDGQLRNNDGAQPQALIQATDGNLYGTTKIGGHGSNTGYGTIFKITTGGALTVLHNFLGTDGGYPLAALVQGPDGTFYGTTSKGGANNLGTIFKITAAGVFTSLYSFAGDAYAPLPSSPLTLGADGNFYGTTGGTPTTSEPSTVFRISPTGEFATVVSLGDTVGELPGGLVRADDGNLYGTTIQGGPNGYGSIFKIDASGQLSVVFAFSSTFQNRDYISHDLTRGSDGLLYGPQGDNGIIAFDPAAGEVSVLAEAPYGNAIGSAPESELVEGAGGLVYGVTVAGGPNGYGTVYQIDAAENLSTFYAFTRADGLIPYTALVLAPNGNFYGGATSPGGEGKIYQLTPGGLLTVVQTLTQTQGALPSRLTVGADGNFYGTAYNGGANGSGTVFKLDAASGAVTVLHTFSALSTGGSVQINADGAQPVDGLSAGADGSFYGAANQGGANGAGTVFRINPAGVFSALYSFAAAPAAGGTNPGGSLPGGPPIQAADGNLYGTAKVGGANGTGTIYRLTPAGAFSVVHDFTVSKGRFGGGNGDGTFPSARLLQSQDGYLYGTAQGGGYYDHGAGFRLRTDGTDLRLLFSAGGQYSDGSNDGGLFYHEPLMQTRAGRFYFTTRQGGTSSLGVALGFDLLPTANSLTNATGVVGRAFSSQIVAEANPTGYTATGLPPGLSLNAGTGRISGTPTTRGTYNVQFSATYANEPTPYTLTMAIVINPPPPAITSATSLRGRVGDVLQYEILATNSPTNYGAAYLPPGVTIQQPSPIIQGTPTKAGTYSVVIAAFNETGSGSATLTVTIVDTPRVTSAPTASATVGQAFSYRITGTNSPTKYGAAYLPAGLSIDQKTGLITGTPTTVGTYSVVIAAFNASGSGTETLALTVAQPSAPKITSALTASATVGQAFTYQIKATGLPTKYGAANLPAGLTINQTTGKISGTPTAGGTFTVTIAAFNSRGSGAAALKLKIKVPPVITGATSATATQGSPFSYQILATNSPGSYAASGLPAGLSTNMTTGKISGTPAKAGTYQVTMAAYNVDGGGGAILTLVVKPPA